MKINTLTTAFSLILFTLFNSVLFGQTQTYTTPGASTFTVPDGVTSITVEAWGGGGRGGIRTVNSRGGGGGGGGAYSSSVITVTPGTTYNLTVGAGGSTPTGTAGNSFFDTTSVVNAPGGSNVNNSNAGGAGAIAGAGTIALTGGAGAAQTLNSNGGGGGSSAGTVLNGTTATNGTGGIAPAGGGNGGNGATNAGVVATNGSYPGGGGGGNYLTGGGVNYAHGNGGDGQVRITWTCSGVNLSNLSLPALSNICTTNTTTVTVNSTSLASGTYTVYYSVSGANTIANTAATMVFTVGSPGTGTFTTAALNTAGASTIKVNSIGCAYINSGNTVAITVNAPSDTVNNGGNTAATISKGGTSLALAGSFGGTATAAIWSDTIGGTFTNNSGATPATTLYTPPPGYTGTTTLRLTSTGVGCPAITTKNITVTEVVFLIAPSPVCAGSQQVYAVTYVSASTSYTWTLPAGWATVGNKKDDTITVITSSTGGVISVTPYNTSSSGTTVTSGTITVNVSSFYITSAVPGTRNLQGTVNLSATATGGTINWYDMSTGGTLLGTGANFTTPVISQTTTYYVETNDGCSSPRIPVDAIVLAPEIELLGNANIILDGDIIPSHLDNTNFGEITVNSPIVKTFEIQNRGTLPLTISSVTVTGPDAADFTITTSPVSPILSGIFTPFTVTFSSTTVGTKNATITINNDDSTEAVYDFAIQATTVAAPVAAEITIEANATLIPNGSGAADVNPANFTDFGLNYIGVPVTKTYSIKNIGIAPLTISSLSSSNTVDFTVAPIATTIAAGASYNFNITYNSITEGAQTGIITINNNDSNENPYTFAIKGTGVILGKTQDIQILGNNVNIPHQSYSTFLSNYTNLGNTFVGNPLTKTYTVKNLGLQDLTVSSWLVGGVNPSEFTISSISSPVVGGDQTTFTITFTPIAIGHRYAQVTIVNNSPGRTNFTFAIEGLGLTPTVNPTIEVEGNLVNITNGDITPSVPDNTDFGALQINNEKFKTFTIQNIGTNPLTLTGTPKVTISGAGAADFSVTSQPASPLNSLDVTSFTIRFNPTDLTAPTFREATVSIASDDTGANPFTFDIIGHSIQTFFDSDNDGVFDNIDIDDDNDGIRDVTEEANCNLMIADSKVNYKFLYETFGSGGRTTINATYPALTNYIYQDATTPTAGDNGTVTTSLIDGKYTVASSAQVADFAPRSWYKGTDHTGDTDGRMALFNASFFPGTFYEAEIKGALPAVPIVYSFWALNLDRTDIINIGTRKRPNILVEFRDNSGALLSSLSTGPIQPTSAGNLAGDWQQFTSTLTFPVGTFKVLFINNESGGGGNDLALDDIIISQALCDRDGDGVSDVFDLDADDDGIPDVVEAGLGNTTNGKAKIDIAWLDLNENGMHDSVEAALPPLDSDGDTIPNYIDLDSDNDSLFDVDESGAGNTTVGAPLGFTNGDGDISGDGTGDGPEVEAFRSKDSDGDGIIELFGDGILDIYDYDGTGTAFNDQYGNTNQGIASGNPATTYLKDTDSDLIPDYLDVMSNGTTFDIAPNIKIYDYKTLDANNDGIIDGMADADKDGIIDTFDTSFSPAYFGSPRDLHTKLLLDFDGRNDYAESTSILGGLPQVSLMAWINLNSAFSTRGVIVGQQNFQILVVEGSGRLRVVHNGTNYSVPSAAGIIPTAQWTHVAVTYDGTNIKTYINGIIVNTALASGNIAADATLLTIGKNPAAGDHYFKGKIDEVRVFNTALTASQLQRMVYQEINDNAGEIRGEIVPKNIATSPASLPFTNLLRYYRMDNYKDDIIDDLTTPAIDLTGTKIYNHKNIYLQEAPMPFVTLRAGTFAAAVDDTIKEIIGTDINNDYSIVQVKHDITETSTSSTDLGTFVDPGVTITMNDGTKIQNDWYLKLDGKIDLVGKAQLVQTSESDLDVTSAGSIERDQQGQSNLYNYNYWSSPVSPINITANNTDYAVTTVMKDGFNAIPRNINWISGYDGIAGDATTPVSLASHWLYKFETNTDVYANWIQFSETDNLRVGQGYTLKGSGAASKITFVGKPNNGLINTNSVAANDLLLVGNPYPSALDGYQFINDNIINKGSGDGTVTDGTLFFWEHAPENNTHILSGYIGGYAVLNLTGGLPKVAPALISGAGSLGVTPQQYIPVGQSFFVYGGAIGGPVVFNNGQRAYKVETDPDSTPLFKTKDKSKTKQNTTNQEPIEPAYKKLRLGFNSSTNYHRQVLLGFMEDKATNAIDPGYDALNLDEFPADMYFLHGETQLVIQGEGHFDEESSYPIGVKTDTEGKISFVIDEQQNFSPSQNIYIYDALTNEYYDIRTTKYEVNVPAGTDNQRFSLRFKIKVPAEPTLDNIKNSVKNSTIYVAVAQNNKMMTINNQMEYTIDQVTLANTNGQIVAQHKVENQEQKNIQIQIQNIAAGVYIVKLKTKNGEIDKKIIVK